MDEFENLLEAERIAVERFVKFQIGPGADSDDVLQEVFLTAYQKFPQLKNREAFKAWVISIARNKCNDYFRKKATRYEIPIDALTERELSDGRQGVSVVNTVPKTRSTAHRWSDKTSPMAGGHGGFDCFFGKLAWLAG